MTSPSRAHQKILSELHITIGQYIREKGSACEVYPAPFAVKLFDNDKTIVEPDISVICAPDKLTDKGCTGAPDWIIEIISPSTSSHDYIRKLNLYADAGVREYWIVNPIEHSVYVYILEGANFRATAYTFKDFYPIGSAAAEKEKRAFFKRILVVFVTYDRGKTINPFPKINITACQDHTPDAGSIFKHGLPPP